MRQRLSQLLRQVNTATRSTPRRHSGLSTPVYAYFSISSAMSTSENRQPSRLDFEMVEDVESPAYYQEGGFHPVLIGNELNGRYRVVHKLGQGGCSTIWLVRDQQSQKLLAAKVGAAESDDNEVHVLSALTGPNASTSNDPAKEHIPPLLDVFKINGPNGTHPCHITTPAQMSRTDLRELVGFFRVDVARSLAAQLTLAVAYTHSKGYVHGDIHPGNILFGMDPSFMDLSDQQLYKDYGEPQLQQIVRCDGQPLATGVPPYLVTPIWLAKEGVDFTLSEARLILSDFGEAFSPSKIDKFESNTPLAGRPPESRFEPSKPLSFSADIWSLACAIWELCGRDQLFNAGWFCTEDEMTYQHVMALGVLPKKWWDSWTKRGEWFSVTGEIVKHDRATTLEQSFEEGVQQPRRAKGFETFGPDESQAFLAMIRQMLTFRPEDRPSVQQVLDCKWMRKWALPTYRDSLKTKG